MLFQENYDPFVAAHGLTTQRQSYISTINASSGNTTLTQGRRGQTFLFDSATGITYTLPTPIAGTEFHFIVTNTVTSGSHKIITDAATTFLMGAVFEGSTGVAPLTFQGNGTSHISVTMGGTTTGGLIGTALKFKAVSTSLWEVTGFMPSAASPATPFSNT